VPLAPSPPSRHSSRGPRSEAAAGSHSLLRSFIAFEVNCRGFFYIIARHPNIKTEFNLNGWTTTHRKDAWFIHPR